MPEFHTFARAQKTLGNKSGLAETQVNQCRSAITWLGQPRKWGDAKEANTTVSLYTVESVQGMMMSNCCKSQVAEGQSCQLYVQIWKSHHRPF